MEESTGGGSGGISRRTFIKGMAVGALGAFAGAGALSALGYIKGPPEVLPEWEKTPGVVDYSMLQGIEGKLTGPTPHTLKVAQWYDYWPGSFLDDFTSYMSETHGLDVDVEWDVFTSNEELFNLITIGRNSYDVMVPTNYYADLYKKAGVIYNLHEPWLPDAVNNIDWDLVQRPRDDPWNRRGRDLIGVPYFWGTTGVGYRTDVIDSHDMADIGYEIFQMDTYRTPSGTTVDLRKKMRMLDEMNDAFTAGFKDSGWAWQQQQGWSPSGLLPDFGGHQWSSSETDLDRVKACGHWLWAAKPRLFDFNSTEAYTTLGVKTAYANQDWNGDIVYAKRPDQNASQPVDYIVPKQGSTIWFDCVCIHSKCRNLWVAHEFINFIHKMDPKWNENELLTKWNMYSTPNKACYEQIKKEEEDPMSPLFPWPNTTWRMTEDPTLYPNVTAPETLKRCDVSRYKDLDTLLTEYNPIWNDLTAV